MQVRDDITVSNRCVRACEYLRALACRARPTRGGSGRAAGSSPTNCAASQPDCGGTADDRPATHSPHCRRAADAAGALQVREIRE